MAHPPASDDVLALRRRAAGLAALVEVSGTLAGTLDLTEILQSTTDGVCRLAGFDTAAVYLLHGPTLRIGATTPPLPPGFPEPLRLARLADHPHIARALAAGATVMVPDALQEVLTESERVAVEQRGLRAILYAPMIAGVKPVGVLIVSDTSAARALGPDEVDLCRTLAALAALAAENARLFEASRAHAAEVERQAAEARRADAERLELERRLLHAQKLESLGVLAGGIAHDFNNLLQAILANLELARPGLAPGTPEGEALAEATGAARRASALTRQLLAYSGRGRFRVEALDLSALVRDGAGLLRAAAPRTCAVALRLAEGLPAVEADAGQLQQVAMNLLANAAEAVGARPGTITVTTAARPGGPAAVAGSLVPVAEPAAAYVALEIADDGEGMSPEILSRIFDPFFSTRGPGRGLGLSALQGIVRGHHGALFVESAPGRGTTVRVLLPAAGAAPSLAPAQGEAPPLPDLAAVVGGTVLVVDDEDLVRRASQAMLRSLGLPVRTAASGAEALTVLRAYPGEIRAVLLDLSMPGMDGIATLEALLAADPTLRVVLASGFDQQALHGRVAAGHAAGFLQKPFSRDELREALGRLGAAPPEAP